MIIHVVNHKNLINFKLMHAQNATNPRNAWALLECMHGHVKILKCKFQIMFLYDTWDSWDYFKNDSSKKDFLCYVAHLSTCSLFFFFFLDKHGCLNFFEYLTILSSVCSPLVPLAPGYFKEESHEGSPKMLARGFKLIILCKSSHVIMLPIYPHV